ncbi:MAG: hypothetical protein HYV63_08150 [Candidatus Schekmanbacteria bacterium]|nr:hypothetical protein [Candidatus Schekmanbacteria bacterium]
MCNPINTSCPSPTTHASFPQNPATTVVTPNPEPASGRPGPQPTAPGSDHYEPAGATDPGAIGAANAQAPSVCSNRRGDLIREISGMSDEQLRARARGRETEDLVRDHERAAADRDPQMTRLRTSVQRELGRRADRLSDDQIARLGRDGFHVDPNPPTISADDRRSYTYTPDQLRRQAAGMPVDPRAEREREALNAIRTTGPMGTLPMVAAAATGDPDNVMQTSRAGRAMDAMVGAAAARRAAAHGAPFTPNNPRSALPAAPHPLRTQPGAADSTPRP